MGALVHDKESVRLIVMHVVEVCHTQKEEEGIPLLPGNHSAACSNRDAQYMLSCFDGLPKLCICSHAVIHAAYQKTAFSSSPSIA